MTSNKQMPRVIKFELHEHGWASAEINVGGARIVVRASFIIDSITGMAESLLSACRGENEVEWVYFSEPGATHVIFESSQSRLTILQSDNDFKFPRPKAGYRTRVLAQGTVELKDLINDAINIGSGLIGLYGEAGYKERWRSNYPRKEIEMLKQLRRDKAF